MKHRGSSPMGWTQSWTWFAFTNGLGLVGLGLGRIFEISVGWVGFGRREQLHIIQQLQVKYWTSAFTTSTLYFSKIECL